MQSECLGNVGATVECGLSRGGDYGTGGKGRAAGDSYLTRPWYVSQKFLPC